MTDDVLIAVEGVSKKFCRSLKRSLWYGVQDVAGELLGRKGNSDQLRKNEFWAVRDVSFELRRGECLGFIGANGAGKSTLLKMLNGLIKPDRGTITMRGRVGALIELGAGFNPILTARENIYVNGAVLGFTKNEIEKKFDSIIEFAELDQFVDTPVQNFSSGMKVRLGFAIAAQMDPDILLIDEVLAVGDVGFRMKCFNAIREKTKECAVVLVSHQMPEISRSCTAGLLIAGGSSSLKSNNVSEVIQAYREQFEGGDPIIENSQLAEIKSVRTINSRGDTVRHVKHGDSLLIEIIAQIDRSVTNPSFGITFTDSNLHLILQCHSEFDNCEIVNMGGTTSMLVTVNQIPLGPGRYSVSVGIDGPNHSQLLCRYIDACHIQVTGEFVGFAPTIGHAKWVVDR